MAIQRINLGTAPSGTGGDTNRTAFKKIDDNFADSANAASRQVGTAAGNVMEVGAFGVGRGPVDVDSLAQPKSGFYAYSSLNASDTSTAPTYQMIIQASWYDDSNSAQLLFGLNGNNQVGFRTWDNAAKTWRTYKKIYHEGNTTKDSNGFLKGASPIVRLFADKIECNDEAKLQDVTFEKLGVGDYLVKGSLGFAQEGWYIEMPKDANGNVLVAVVYKQLANNDISVKTYAKKFDEETGDVVANTAKPRDIPSTRWIDLRLQALPQEDIQPLDTDETVNTNAE